MKALDRIIRSAGLVTALALTATTASAQSWYAVFSGAAEAPPNASPGTGFATFTLLGNVLTINGSFSGLVGTTTASHIHCCVATPGAGTAGVATTTPNFVGFPLGVTSGAFSITLDLTQAGSFNAAFITANGGTTASAAAALIAGMNNGRAYMNIHSTNVTAGEIRGFVNVVPEPSTYALMATGLFGIALVGVRRRRSAD